MLKLEYFKIIIFFCVAFLFVSLLIILSFLLNKNIFKMNSKKPVECGSHSFGSGKSKVEINFYIITILFVIFEVEFIVIIPWLFYWDLTYSYSFVIILSFLLILIIGLIFEYCRGIFQLENKQTYYKSGDYVDSLNNFLTNLLADIFFFADLFKKFIINVSLFILKSADNSDFKINLYTMIKNCFKK